MRILALYGFNGALLFGVGLYWGAFIVWFGTRAHVVNPPRPMNPRRSTLMDQPRRGPECRW